MLLNFNLSFEKDIAHDDICRTVIEVVEEVNIAKYVNFTNRNAHGYDGVMMFKLIMLAMADRGYVSTRKLSKLCKTDIRYMFIAQNQKPSHQAFQRFIHDDLTMPIEDIFYEINKYIESKISINTDVLCIDGTKYEANANKNTFVWRANTIRNRTKRWKKVILCLKKINKYFAEQNIALNYSLLKEPSIEYMLAVADGIERYMKDYDIEFVHGKGKRKTPLQRSIETLESYIQKLKEYIKKIHLCGTRNSYSKTDPDATFMRMKEDAMMNGQLKPAYNLQHGVDSEYITWIDISAKPTDTGTLIPFLKDMEKHLSFRYQEIVADAGYESEENYLFLEKNGQSSFIKPMNYEISKTRKYKKDIGKMENMEYDPEKDSYRCQNRKMLTVQYQRKQKTATGYLRTVTVYQCHECKGCPFKEKCIKGNNCKTPMEKREKRLYVSKVMKQKREENVKRIISEYGNQLRMNRSIQAEGSFANVKEDMNFRRYLYRGKENVTAQSVILAIGYNINKLHHKIQNGRTGQHLFALKK